MTQLVLTLLLLLVPLLANGNDLFLSDADSNPTNDFSYASKQNSIHFDSAHELGCLPVYYEGRVRPFDSCARLWLNEVYHRETLLPEHEKMLGLVQNSSLDVLWFLQGSNDPAIFSVPFFWIGERGLKSLLQLDLVSSRFSFNQLRYAFEDVVAINLKVIEQMILSSFFKISQGATFAAGEKIRLQIINAEIECLFFDHKLLVTSVPARIPWHFLSAMCLSSPYTIDLSESRQAPYAKSLYALVFHFLQFKEAQTAHSLLNTVFMSPFSSELFNDSSPQISEISSLYNSIFSQKIHHLGWALHQFFNRYQTAIGQGLLSYPTLFQLRAEKAFIKFPILKSSAACYGLGLLLFLAYSLRKIRKKLGKTLCAVLKWTTWVLIGAGFVLHGGALLFKAVVFSYPPLSTMFDSVLFVAWLSMLIGFIFYVIFRTKFPVFGALICTESLYLLLWALNVRDPFAPVDPVLNSGFWLTVHVAMVASSYGVLLLGGILGHLSLLHLFRNKKEPSPVLSQCIVHCVYLGSFFLVIGTLLGALWADSSWGRFWDWDAKESCALISICFYLTLIHLNHFKWVGSFAMAFGTSIGMLVISFTWYGVNYLVGTGLHSYGRGNGGELFYLAFIAIEVIFLGVAWMQKRRLNLSRCASSDQV